MINILHFLKNYKVSFQVWMHSSMLTSWKILSIELKSMFMLSKRYNERNGIMGLLINGIWYDTSKQSVENQQKVEKDKWKFRNWITKDGSSGPSGVSGFKAERTRYHLYVSYACP